MKQALKRRFWLRTIGLLALLALLVVRFPIRQEKALEPVSAYMAVIDHLMKHEGGPSTGTQYLAIDITQITNLTAAEKADLLSRMEKYRMVVLENTRTELEATGLVQGLNFPNGRLIIIATRQVASLAMTVDAQIWRGGAAGYGMKGLRLAYVNAKWQLGEMDSLFIA